MSRAFNMLSAIAFLLILVVPVSLSRTGNEQQEGSGSQSCNGLRFTHILSQKHSGFDEPDMGIINDRNGWFRFWDRMYGSLDPKPPCDTSLIDFEKETVIYVASGTRPNGCYGTRINCVKAHEGTLLVEYDETVPGKGCICLSVLVAPVDVVKIKKYEGPVDFHRSIKEMPCP